MSNRNWQDDCLSPMAILAVLMMLVLGLCCLCSTGCGRRLLTKQPTSKRRPRPKSRRRCDASPWLVGQ